MADEARRRLLTACIAIVGLATIPATAQAGRLLETGHDADFHCAREQKECHFVKVAISYVRGGAPNPTKPVLVLDRRDLDLRDAINLAFGFGNVPMVIMSPQDAAFPTTPITTSIYSAIAIASDVSCGGCDLNENPPSFGQPAVLDDTNPIEARAQDIADFFDAGGGIYVGSGADNGDGHTGDHYYDFVDTPGGLPANGPFSLTPFGRALGLTDGSAGTPDDINCCATHNSFLTPPVGSRLRVAELDAGDMFLGRTTLFEDSDPPNTIVTGGPSGLVVGSTSARFSFTASEDRTSFACRVDDAAFAACSSPATFTGLREGAHTFSVVATDLGGNADATPAARAFTIGLDRDHDGFTRFSPRPDCNDRKKAIHPGAREIPGNLVDENCDGVVVPFPRLRFTFDFAFTGGGGVEFTRFRLGSISRGAKVVVLCSGSGCPFASRRAVVRRRRADIGRLLGGARFFGDATLEIRAVRALAIGKVLRLTISSGSIAGRRTLCLAPRARRPTATCADFTVRSH